jgi:hypothetical protein
VVSQGSQWLCKLWRCKPLQCHCNAHKAWVNLTYTRSLPLARTAARCKTASSVASCRPALLVLESAAGSRSRTPRSG